MNTFVAEIQKSEGYVSEYVSAKYPLDPCSDIACTMVYLFPLPPRNTNLSCCTCLPPFIIHTSLTLHTLAVLCSSLNYNPPHRWKTSFYIRHVVSSRLAGGS